jgi:hypothetical protein
MDATTLYMMITLPSGLQYIDSSFPFPTSRECREAVERMERNDRIAAFHRARGEQLTIYCAPPRKPLKIAL